MRKKSLVDDDEICSFVQLALVGNTASCGGVRKCFSKTSNFTVFRFFEDFPAAYTGPCGVSGFVVIL